MVSVTISWIDKAVYRLYNSNKDEIKVVEGGDYYMKDSQTITIQVPDTLYGIIGNDDSAVEKDIYRALAIKLYLDEKMSIGKASEIAGMNRVDFETYLSEHQIPISLLTYEDVMQDVQKMRDV